VRPNFKRVLLHLYAFSVAFAFVAAAIDLGVSPWGACSL
jgi:hypothetical protein